MSILDILERRPEAAVACYVSPHLAGVFMREVLSGAIPPSTVGSALRAPVFGGMAFYVDKGLTGDEYRFANEDPHADDHLWRSEN